MFDDADERPEELPVSRLLPRKKEVYEALEEFHHNQDLDVKILAESVDLDERQFRSMYANYKDMQVTHTEGSMPRAKNKTRVTLNYEQKLEVFRRIKKGADRDAVAKSFNIARQTVNNITSYFKQNPPPEEKPAVIEPVPVVAAIVQAFDPKITFDGDFVIISIPKKLITSELLKGLI